MTLAIRDSTTPDSMLARWDTRWKLAAVCVWIVGAVSLQSLAGAVLALGVALIFAALGRLSVNGVVGRLLLLMSTVLPLLIVVPLVQRDAGTVWHVGPVRISEVAMWLMDHQMNQRVSEAFGKSYERLPLKESPHIVKLAAAHADGRPRIGVGSWTPCSM